MRGEYAKSNFAWYFYRRSTWKSKGALGSNRESAAEPSSERRQ